jgi:hypothetical protein
MPLVIDTLNDKLWTVENGLVDCGLFLDGQIDALALRLGER